MSRKEDFIDDEYDNDVSSSSEDEVPANSQEEESDESDDYSEQEENSEDEISPDLEDEVEFSENAKKPANCDKCKKDIVNFIDLTYCTNCMYTIHVKCYENGGCRTCTEEAF